MAVIAETFDAGAMSYTVSNTAYMKMFFHAAKHPHQPVNGVLLGKTSSSGGVFIEEVIPLLHHWTSLSPMMEIGLELVSRSHTLMHYLSTRTLLQRHGGMQNH
jgi:hypothetical protein